jgi:GNAT superfamily N-acetyltransferase
VTVTTRPVTPDDVELICDQRERLFRESNSPGRTEEVIRTQTAHFRPWLVPRLRDGSYFGFILEDAGKAVAGIGLMVIEWPPGPNHPTSDKRGYVLNVFVEPTHRRQGLAEKLMALADSEFTRRGATYAVLNATKMGRPLYEKLGWTATNEMAKVLR